MESTIEAIGSKQQIVQLTADDISRITQTNAFKPIWTILISPERLASCDVGILIKEDGQDVSIATVASSSIKYPKEPEIAGLYTPPRFRGHGYASLAMKRALEWCIQQGLDSVHVDATSKGTAQICSKLPEDLKRIVRLHDTGTYIDVLMEEEERKLGLYD